MIMYALYYICPETGRRLACVSVRHMDFDADADPTLFANKENLEKELRDYKRIAIDYHLIKTGHKTYLAKDRSRPTNYRVEPPIEQYLSGADDMSNFRIVPMMITPDFENEYTYEVPAKKGKNG